MKVSELWLREWTNPVVDGQQLAAMLTMAGLEVDSLTPVAAVFDKVIIAQVSSTKPHPQADKLTLCEIITGQGPKLAVVCGATNVRTGMKVALAQIGAALPGGLTIKEATLRGQLSQGMLCSSTELGLTEHSEGIMELSEDSPLGMDLRDYLQLEDQILEVDLTPNRADCFSVLGIAREAAALTQTPLKACSQTAVSPTIEDHLAIKVTAATACPHYSGRIIRGINPEAKTPLWMSERLRRSGLRTIHPVVDITNYVMLELGQPMHAFDLSKIQGELQIRFAKEDEELTLLDGQSIRLHNKVLVIVDQEKVLAMAGIMGGEASAVQENTREIFLEAAFFHPLALAGVARAYGLCTDSSQRFERGVDPSLPILALERATSLLIDITGGSAGPIVTREDSQPAVPNKILFNPAKLKQLIGIDIPLHEMATMLESLSMRVDQKEAFWEVTIPSHRFDLHLDVDLVEEIIRVYGYDKLKGATLTSTVQGGTTTMHESLSRRISQFFVDRGYHETISYSFVDPELQQAIYPNRPNLQLLNPISSELSQMRLGLWPGLIASLIHNVHRQQTGIKFFETGTSFNLEQGELTESPCIAGLLYGERQGLNWSELTRSFDFYDLKGDLQALFASLKLKNVTFIPGEYDTLHPGRTAEIRIENEPAGWCGVLHPRLTDALDLQEEVIIFELRLKALSKIAPARYQAISKFPQIRRDLSFLVDHNITAAMIETVVRSLVEPERLKSFDVFDVYQGDSIAAGKKSLAIALTLKDDKRTMVDAEINHLISAIIIELEEKFAIILRD